MPMIHPFHLDFSGGLHLGARGINLEESSTMVPADTLPAHIRFPPCW